MKYLCTLICAMLLMMEGNAKLLRVGFSGVPEVAGVDYSTFYTAYQAATNGDTIYVWPGKVINSGDWPTNGNWAIIKKKLSIISKGNWLDANSNPKGNTSFQASLGTGGFGGVTDYYGYRYVYFATGSEGSVLSGFDAGYSRILIQTNNITIKRNAFVIVNFGNNNASNILIEGNYRVSFEGNDDDRNIYENIIIRNNFISSMSLPNKKYTGTIENNVWAHDRTNSNNGGGNVQSNANINYYGTWDYNQSQILLRYGTWLFQNNLIVSYSGTTINESAFLIQQADNTTFAFNVALASTNFTYWPGTDIGNNKFVPVADINTIFEAFPNISTSTADTRYRLKANSPAKEGRVAGDTTDAGMFGGPNPYKLSTISSIPTIYNINSPTGNTATGTTIQINISTRSNN